MVLVWTILDAIDPFTVESEPQIITVIVAAFELTERARCNQFFTTSLSLAYERAQVMIDKLSTADLSIDYWSCRWRKSVIQICQSNYLIAVIRLDICKIVDLRLYRLVHTFKPTAINSTTGLKVLA